MPSLHVEPDQLFLTSRTFWQANYRMVDHLFILRLSLLHLKMSWQGVNADEFFTETNPILQQLFDRTEDLLSMSLLLSRQADLWDESDERWKGIFCNFPAERSGGESA